MVEKKKRSDLKVAKAANGDVGPEYIATSLQREKGEYDDVSDENNV